MLFEQRCKPKDHDEEGKRSNAENVRYDEMVGELKFQAIAWFLRNHTDPETRFAEFKNVFDAIYRGGKRRKNRPNVPALVAALYDTVSATAVDEKDREQQILAHLKGHDLDRFRESKMMRIVSGVCSIVMLFRRVCCIFVAVQTQHANSDSRANSTRRSRSSLRCWRRFCRSAGQAERRRQEARARGGCRRRQCRHCATSVA
jgi:hypothetical protein